MLSLFLLIEFVMLSWGSFGGDLEAIRGEFSKQL